ncbi:hypothetical protein DFH09DRAFT_1100410 [Mycena vulgaris]|nr:hypothetical protein DFH09DRAFT_1100410 [Mycena vulgaris]
MSSTAVTVYHHIIYALRLRNYSDGDEKYTQPVSRLSEQTGLPSRQTGLQANLPGLGFDLHPNPSPSPNKPVGAGASPFGKPKSELSNWCFEDTQTKPFEVGDMRMSTKFEARMAVRVANQQFENTAPGQAMQSGWIFRRTPMNPKCGKDESEDAAPDFKRHLCQNGTGGVTVSSKHHKIKIK